MRTKRLLIAGLLTILALATVHAGGVQQETPSGSGDPAAESQFPETVRIAFDFPVSSLDPMRGDNSRKVQGEFLMSARLTEYRTVEPELARSVTESADRLSWVAELRPGLRFSDGSDLTAEDVVATFENNILPPLARLTPSEFRTLARVEATGPTTVVFHLSEPNSEFDVSLSTHYASIFPAEGLAQGEDFWLKPVSAGPFAVESADFATGRVTMVANPYYLHGEPSVKRIEITHVPEPATRVAQLNAGQVDWIELVPATLLPQLNPGTRTVPSPFPGGVVFLSFNRAHNSVVNDVRVRQAINLAIDREQISDIAFGGTMQPVYGMIWPDEDLPQIAPFERDVEAARRLLVGTECEDGCTLTLLNQVGGNWFLPPMNLVVQQNLREIGIEIEQVNLTPSDYYGRRQLQDDWDIWTSSVITSSAIGGAATSVYDGASGGSIRWLTPGFSDPEMTALAARLRSAPRSEFDDIVGALNDRAEEILPWIAATDLMFVRATTLPESVISVVDGYKLVVW